MAFTLQRAYLYKIDTPSPVRKYGQQVAEFNITRLNTDTALDLGNFTGTFWTAVGATGFGPQLLTAWKQVLAGAESLVNVQMTTDTGFLIRVASGPTADQFALDNSATFPKIQPSIVLANGSGPVSLKVLIVLSLLPQANTVDFGV